MSTFLSSFNVGIIIFFAFVLATIFVISVDLAIAEYHEAKKISSHLYRGRHTNKEIIRLAKESAAYKGFFEESYVTRVDANGSVFHQLVMVPTPTALAYYDEMDRLADEQIFDNTKDL